MDWACELGWGDKEGMLAKFCCGNRYGNFYLQNQGDENTTLRLTLGG